MFPALTPIRSALALGFLFLALLLRVSVGHAGIRDSIDRLSFNKGKGTRYVVIPGIGVSGRVEVGLRKGYEPNQYIRTDTWKFGVDVSLRSLFPGFAPGIPGDVLLSAGKEIRFYRVMPTQRKAVLALPLLPTQVPLSSKGLEKLQPGTFVSIPGHTRVALAAGYSQELLKAIPQLGLRASAGATVYVEGEVELFVHKKSENEVELQVRAQKEAGLVIGVNAGIEPRLFRDNKEVKKTVRSDEISEPATRYLDKALASTVLSIEAYSRDAGTLALSSYAYDLRSPDARAALDQAMSSALKPQSARVLFRGKIGSEDLGRGLASVNSRATSASDEIAEADQGKPFARVTRTLQAVNHYKGASTGASVKLRVFDGGFRNRRSMNNIRYVEAVPGQPDPTRHALLATQVRTSNKRVLFGLLGSENSRESSYVAGETSRSTDATHEGLDEVGYSFEHRDTRMSTKEAREYQDKLLKALGPEAYARIAPDLRALESKVRGSQRLSSLNVQASLQREGLDLLAHAVIRGAAVHGNDPRKFFEMELRDYMENIEAAQGARFKLGFLGLGKGMSVTSTAKKLAEAFTVAPDEAGRQKLVSKILKMSQGGLFSQMRLGFFIHLIRKQFPGVSLDRIAHLEMKLNASDLPKIERVYLAGSGPSKAQSLERIVRTTEGSELPENRFNPNRIQSAL